MELSLENLIDTIPLLRQQFQKAQRKYKAELQQALYADLTMVEDFLTHNQLKDDQNEPVLLLNIPQVYENTLLHRLYLLLIRHYQQLKEQNNPLGRLSLVVVSSQQQNKTSEANLVSLLRLAPRGLIQMIKRIVILHPVSYYTGPTHQNKTSDSFWKYLKRVTHHINNVYFLQALGLWSVFSRVRLSLESGYSASSEDLDRNRMNYFKAANLKSTVCFDLGSLIGEKMQTKCHQSIQSYQLNDFHVPQVLILLTCQLYAREESLRTQGLFRISASILDVEEALKAVDSQNLELLSEETNPHIIANLIKKVFNRLKQPLFPFDLYEMVVWHDFDGQERLQNMVSIVGRLPLANYLTLKYMLWFFKEFIFPFQSSNQMTPHNMAVVFTPAWLRSPSTKVSELDMTNLQKALVFVRKLINQSDQVFNRCDKAKDASKCLLAASHQEVETQTVIGEQQPIQAPAESVVKVLVTDILPSQVMPEEGKRDSVDSEAEVIQSNDDKVQDQPHQMTATSNSKLD